MICTREFVEATERVCGGSAKMTTQQALRLEGEQTFVHTVLVTLLVYTLHILLYRYLCCCRILSRVLSMRILPVGWWEQEEVEGGPRAGCAAPLRKIFILYHRVQLLDLLVFREVMRSSML